MTKDSEPCPWIHPKYFVFFIHILFSKIPCQTAFHLTFIYFLKISFWFFPFTPNLVANCTLSIPIAHVSWGYTTTMSPGSPRRSRHTFSELHRLKAPRPWFRGARGSVVWADPTNPSESLPPPSERWANYAAPSCARQIRLWQDPGREPPVQGLML